MIIDNYYSDHAHFFIQVKVTVILEVHLKEHFGFGDRQSALYAGPRCQQDASGGQRHWARQLHLGATRRVVGATRGASRAAAAVSASASGALGIGDGNAASRGVIATQFLIGDPVGTFLHKRPAAHPTAGQTKKFVFLKASETNNALKQDHILFASSHSSRKIGERGPSCRV